ncbi:tetratricopeptide repeat protein [Pseudoduganella aquatica]|nr:tetratricopeptide repeat protein [Pseudoduganella aquatica]
MKSTHLLAGASVVLAGAVLAWSMHGAATPAGAGASRSAAGPDAPPSSAQIEAAAMSASQTGSPEARQQLQRWARQGLPVAERELGTLYRKQPERLGAARQLLEHAARAGDVEAAFQLGELLRAGGPAQAGQPARAWPWYRQAAEGRHAKAALTLGQMAANGEGVRKDAAVSVQWLAVASELGNAHAMFLLSNAYRYGVGVERDERKGLKWLEEAAEHEYPPALQDLALAVQNDDAQRAGHLLKEASEHRRNNWNKY